MTAGEMIGELMEFGLSQPEIGKVVGTYQSHLSKIKGGVDPHYTLGKKLEALHKHICIQKRPLRTFKIKEN